MDAKILCLNMIVKNETANLERCLRAVAPHISCWVVGDTGSTDGTQAFIRQFFAERGIPGELHSFPFINFAQARNEALSLAHASSLPYDYLLFADADMELVVDDPGFRTKLDASCYEVLQRAGISYWNVRLVRRNAGARYHGVTHEYLGVDGPSKRLEGVWYKDHASGSNRVDKLERDIRLLTEALVHEPENHRYWFYLAQSYRDAGQLAQAAETYAKRAEMGGWEEEAWYSRLQEARCRKDLGDDGAFLRQALAAFSQRPHRAEPLYDLARYHRLHGQNEAAALFAEEGLTLGCPERDSLFVEDYIYNWGLREELSISGYYSASPQRRARGAAACRWLATNLAIPSGTYELAKRNLKFYTRIEHDEGRTPTVPGESKRSTWVPDEPAAGTELMVRGLKERLGGELDRINLQVNHPGWGDDSRPRVVWMHHNADQVWVQWCGDNAVVDLIDCFVFVSSWQREQYLEKFKLPPNRCAVLRNATEVGSSRLWKPGMVWRCAYTSTPFRGLSVLLDAWDSLRPDDAELHIWSSMKLYHADDEPYNHLYDRAEGIPRVFYHGIVANSDLRKALRDIHFLTYPSTFAETSCLAVIEAMAAGCRVIAPALGALPETTSGFAHTYLWDPDEHTHAQTFARILREELSNPWDGQPHMCSAQQRHCVMNFDWDRRVEEWRHLIGEVTREWSLRHAD